MAFPGQSYSLPGSGLQSVWPLPQPLRIGSGPASPARLASPGRHLARFASPGRAQYMAPVPMQASQAVPPYGPVAVYAAVPNPSPPQDTLQRISSVIGQLEAELSQDLVKSASDPQLGSHTLAQSFGEQANWTSPVAVPALDRQISVLENRRAACEDRREQLAELRRLIEESRGLERKNAMKAALSPDDSTGLSDDVASEDGKTEHTTVTDVSTAATEREKNLVDRLVKLEAEVSNLERTLQMGEHAKEQAHLEAREATLSAEASSLRAQEAEDLLTGLRAALDAECARARESDELWRHRASEALDQGERHAEMADQYAAQRVNQSEHERSMISRRLLELEAERTLQIQQLENAHVRDVSDSESNKAAADSAQRELAILKPKFHTLEMRCNTEAQALQSAEASEQWALEQYDTLEQDAEARHSKLASLLREAEAGYQQKHNSLIELQAFQDNASEAHNAALEHMHSVSNSYNWRIEEAEGSHKLQMDEEMHELQMVRSMIGRQLNESEAYLHGTRQELVDAQTALAKEQEARTSLMQRLHESEALGEQGISDLRSARQEQVLMQQALGKADAEIMTLRDRQGQLDDIMMRETKLMTGNIEWEKKYNQLMRQHDEDKDMQDLEWRTQLADVQREHATQMANHMSAEVLVREELRGAESGQYTARAGLESDKMQLNAQIQRIQSESAMKVSILEQELAVERAGNQQVEATSERRHTQSLDKAKMQEARQEQQLGIIREEMMELMNHKAQLEVRLEQARIAAERAETDAARKSIADGDQSAVVQAQFDKIENERQALAKERMSLLQLKEELDLQRRMSQSSSVEMDKVVKERDEAIGLQKKYEERLRDLASKQRDQLADRKFEAEMAQMKHEQHIAELKSEFMSRENRQLTRSLSQYTPDTERTPLRDRAQSAPLNDGQLSHGTSFSSSAVSTARDDRIHISIRTKSITEESSRLLQDTLLVSSNYLECEIHARVTEKEAPPHEHATARRLSREAAEEKINVSQRIMAQIEGLRSLLRELEAEPSIDESEKDIYRRELVMHINRLESELARVQEAQLEGIPEAFQQALQLVHTKGCRGLRWKDGFSMMHWAALNGRRDLVQYLLTKDGGRELLNSQDAAGCTPLTYARRSDHHHLMCSWLESLGAREEAQSARSSAHESAAPSTDRSQNQKTVRFGSGYDTSNLPEAHQKVLEKIESKGWDKMQWANGFTLLHWAAKEGNADLCVHLLTLGADINARDAENLCAVDYAEDAGHVETVDVLAKNGAILKRNRQSARPEGHEMLLRGVPQGFLKAIQDMEKRGWDKMRWARGFTLLHWAAKEGRADLCEYFLTKGANAAAQDVSGKSAIDYAREVGANDVIEVLQNASSGTPRDSPAPRGSPSVTDGSSPANSFAYQSTPDTYQQYPTGTPDPYSQYSTPSQVDSVKRPSGGASFSENDPPRSQPSDPPPRRQPSYGMMDTRPPPSAA